MNVGLTFTIGAKDLASKVLKGVGSAIRDTFVFAGGQLLAQGLVKAMNGLTSFVGMALDAEEANSALDASLRGLGMYTPELSKKLNDLSEAMKDEIGVSDDMTKKLIAQLLTLGVMPEKIGFAARAINALVAAGKEGEGATKAVTKMLEGDLSGFERLSASVKNATTVEEKFAEIQKMLASGYEQQREKLNTVSGAWSALKERVSDAIEDIGLAIFEGASLGKTFGDMQLKVAAFLQGDQWKGFLESVKEGAKFAKELASDLANQGGIKESFVALGDLIVAAFQDGAAKAVEKMKESILGSRIVKVAGTFSDVQKLTPIGMGMDFNKKALGVLISGAEKIEPYIEKGVGFINNAIGKLIDMTPDTKSPSGANVADVIAGIRSTAKSNRPEDAIFKANPWMQGDEGLKASYLRDLQRRKDKVTETEMSASLKVSMQLTLQKEAEIEKVKRLKGLSDNLSKTWEELYASEKRQRDQEKQDRAKATQERYQLLMSEFIDPSKRTERLASEKKASELNAQMEREYAEIQRKQGSMFGLRNPSDREQQVIDLVSAREEAKSAEQDYAKLTADNTKGLAEKLDSLLKISQRG